MSTIEREDIVEFSVLDQGRGVPHDKLLTIFERFEQVDSSDSRERGGTGLGLAIARDIITLHGGRIWVESEPGAGATFRFTLPRVHGTRDPVDSAPDSRPIGRVVDQPVSRHA